MTYDFWNNTGNNNQGNGWHPPMQLGGASSGGGGNGWSNFWNKNNNQLGLNANTFMGGLDFLGGINNMYGSFQAQRNAKNQFNFMKDIANTNLNNQIKTYNTALADRANNRAHFGGWTPEQTQSYIEQNSLKRG